MKKVLIIGGSYFAGRVFAMIANQKGYELSFINRGTYSMSFLSDTVKEYKCDRRSVAGLTQLPVDGEFDAIVDFCAYEPGDVSSLLRSLKVKAKQYIILSTADVYNREIRTPKDESTPLQDHIGNCMAADYMWKKRNLEFEAQATCSQLGIGLTILRPAFIYGPFNYAPRESFFVQRIVQGEPIPVPTDSTSEWNFVFVTDVARAICACIEQQDKSTGQAYNLSAPEVVTYEKYMEVLRKVSDREFTTVQVTVADVLSKNIPLPFPLDFSESELFIGTKIAEQLGVEYSPLEVGMQKAFNSFKSVFER